MRSIGFLNTKEFAERFSQILTVQNIGHRVEKEAQGFEIWIFLDDELPQARDLFQKFLQDPQSVYHPVYEEEANKIKNQIARELKRDRSRPRSIREGWVVFQPRMQPVTTILIIISVVVALFSSLGTDVAGLSKLFITEYVIRGRMMEYRLDLPEITTQYEFWRLVTPAFIHFGFLHALFNLLWLKDLGNMIEWKKGSLFFLFLFLITAIPSNLGQYFMSGPSFGGLSGVVYGLLGYAWMKGKYDPASGLILQRSTVTMMIVWFFLCLTGLMGPVANTAHGAGLVVGMAVGFLDARVFSRR